MVVVGALSGVVVGCGDDDEDAAPAAQPVETVTQPAAEQETGPDDADDKDDDRDDKDDPDDKDDRDDKDDKDDKDDRDND
jgi:hypothetical protein